jgi:hypothetical protein
MLCDACNSAPLYMEEAEMPQARLIVYYDDYHIPFRSLIRILAPADWTAEQIWKWGNEKAKPYFCIGAGINSQLLELSSVDELFDDLPLDPEGPTE